MSREILILPLTEKDGYQHTPVYGRTSDFQNENVPDLFFETLHPDDPDNYFIFTFINPHGYMSRSSTCEESSPILFNRTLHQHDFFELMYVISGEVIQYIEAEQHLYREGSLCLLNRNIRHQISMDKEYIDFIPVEDSSAEQSDIYHLFEILTHQILGPQVGSSYFIKGVILQIFYEHFKRLYGLTPKEYRRKFSDDRSDT